MLKKPQNKAKKRKALENACDKLWSKIVKERAGYGCEICGKADGVQSHHVISRSVKSLRWEVRNGVCLCVNHHMFCTNLSPHKAPLGFAEWFTSKFHWRYEKLKMARGKWKASLEDLENLKLRLQQELRMP